MPRYSAEIRTKNHVRTNCPNSDVQKGDRMSKSKYENRTEIIKLRMTPAEKYELKRLAEKQGLTMSDYIRRVVAKPPEVTREEYNDEIAKAVYEIHKIGVNVNQIAKKYNENEFREPSNYLLKQLEVIYGLAADLRNVVKNS